MTEHFNKETEGTAGLFHSDTKVYVVNNEKLPIFTVRCEQCCGKN